MASGDFTHPTAPDFISRVGTVILAKKEGVAREPGHFSFGPVLKGLWESWPALLMPINAAYGGQAQAHGDGHPQEQQDKEGNQ